MEKVIVAIVMAILVVAAVLGIDWLLWKLWCYVVPQLWENGPAKIIAPGFWFFVGAWTLMVFIGRGIFGSNTSSSK